MTLADEHFWGTATTVVTAGAGFKVESADARGRIVGKPAASPIVGSLLIARQHIRTLSAAGARSPQDAIAAPAGSG